MSDVKVVSPEETQELLDQGYTYVDVRSEPEFEAGHVPGAVNVPLKHRTPQGMADNPEFLSVMSTAFSKDDKLVVACKMGGRSRAACQLLAGAGFTELVDMGAGFDGKRDAFGRAIPGWNAEGRPVETGAPAGQSYADIKQRG